MNFPLLLQIVRARIYFIVFVLVVTVVAAGLFTLSLPKEYSASTSLVLTLNDAGPFDQRGVPTQLAGAYVATQVDIISNRNVALKVADYLGLATTPEVAANFIRAHKAKEPPIDKVVNRDWVADALLSTINVQPGRESRVITINYKSASPVLAAEIANAFAEAYIDTTLQLSMEPAKRNASWFDSQLKVLQTRLEEQQEKLTSYQQAQGIVAVDERLDTETKRLDELSSKLTAAQAQTYDVQSRQLGEQHPEYKRAIDTERSLQGMLQAQKNKVLKVKQERDQLDLMVRDVDNTRSMYDAAIQRYYQTNMESQFNQTNIAVLSKAVVPDKPSGPRIFLNLGLATFLGLAFGVGFSIIAEMLNRRVRIESDLQNELGLTVLASI
jgi:polysaccharide biosynthesis transport protein